MDETTRLYGEITKINMLLELLWAEELFSHGHSPEDVPAIAERVLAKWDNFPSPGGQEYDEFVSARLAEFFSNVQRRVAQNSLEAGRPTD